MPSRTVGERVGRVGERWIPLAKSVRRKRVWGEKCEHVPGVGARWGREGGEEGAETVHTLVSENEARARWERLQLFFYDISRVPSLGNTLDRKLASGDPDSGKLQLFKRTCHTMGQPRTNPPSTNPPQ